MEKNSIVMIFIFGILISAGCGKDSPTATPPFEPPPSISGVWNGHSNSGHALKLTLHAGDNGAISGSGWIGSIGVQVDGKRKYPLIEFKLTTPGFQQAYFTGTLVTADSMTGKFNYSGFTNESTFLSKSN
ncbi:MAG: hypothetical protein KA247_01595 [Bacteroidetes bacterium]|nr:hypothetical protein [Bacteroidota bacterium]